MTSHPSVRLVSPEGEVAVDSPTPAAGVFRKVLLMAFIGFVVIFLSGPIIAALSIVLSIGAVVFGFAFVGFLVWVLFRGLTAGWDVAWQNAKEFGGNLGQVAGKFGRGTVQVLRVPAKGIGMLAYGTARGLGFILSTGFFTLRLVVEAALLVAFGALLGGVWGVVADSPIGGPELAVPLNAAAGAALALLGGLVLLLWPKPKARFQTATQG
jgi:hypothetical protein